jgi:alkanesulfonate monooxygenase SsuD/methylene tetrahydromethanopterin reductase-like flavin-dependent oxidoreductase (luciferase family)
MHHAISIPIFGELSDPLAVADLAAGAEEVGWDGVFVWDHLLRPIEQATHIADPWITMTAIAMRTERVRIGPMVTPIARRRPLKVAREVATLDLASRGRFTLGLGLGVDSGGELSRTGEELDPRVRASMLDEGVALLDRMLRGEPVVHHGAHYEVDGITLAPTGAQSPRVPIWLAARGEAVKPVRRAARYDGVCLLAITPDRLSELCDVIAAERGSLDGFDIIVLRDTRDGWAPYEQRGATWAIHEFRPDQTLADVRAIVTSGPV